MKATKTITKRGNAEMVGCWSWMRYDSDATGEFVLIETSLQPHGSGEFKVRMGAHEARKFAMELLVLLDRIQGTQDNKK